MTGTEPDGPEKRTCALSYTIFGGISDIHRLVIARAIGGLRIE
jgi:hypothetical protein